MISAEMLDSMLSSGCTAEQIVAVVKASLASSSEKTTVRRAKDAERKRRQRHAESRGQVVTSEDNSDSPSPLSPPDKEIPPTTPKEINPPISPQPHRAPRSQRDEFLEFYGLYPNKVGKADAMSAFGPARKRASFEEIMSGLRRYLAKRDDRPWCNPATFLRQDRWADQPASSSQAPTQQVDWQRRMDYYHEKNTWSPAWGPAPGEIGCKAPQQYLNGSLPMGISTRQSSITTSDSSGYQSQT